MVGRNGEHERNRLARLLGAAQELDAAENEPDLALRICGHSVEQRLGVGSLVDDGDPGLGNRRGAAAGPIGRTQPGVAVFGVEAHVHAHPVIVRRDQVPEDVQRQAFELARKIVVMPCFAHQALRAGTVTLQQERTGERELALGAWSAG